MLFYFSQHGLWVGNVEKRCKMGLMGTCECMLLLCLSQQFMFYFLRLHQKPRRPWSPLIPYMRLLSSLILIAIAKLVWIFINLNHLSKKHISRSTLFRRPSVNKTKNLDILMSNRSKV